MQKMRSLAIASLFVLSVGHATLVQEKFAANPVLADWQILGDTNLFQWNATNQNLAVTWDSSRSNSFFHHPLGATFTKADGFCVQFDLNLTDAVATGYFELAIGLCKLADVSSPAFSRANFSSPNLVEFDFFPDGPLSYGPSLDATLIDANNNLSFSYDDSRALVNGVIYRVVLVHHAGESTLSGTIYTNGQIFTSLPNFRDYGADNFQLDTLTISSYTTMDDTYGDALLAHGTVDNLAFASPLPVDKISAVATGGIQFRSDTNWLYTLEQSANFKTWTPAAPVVRGNGTNLVLQATNVPSDKSFYRVRADLP